MFLKYVTETTELGVQVFGMVHGVVFIAYCLVTVLVAIDQRWSLGRTVLGLARGGAAVRDAALRGVRRAPRAARRRVAARATTAPTAPERAVCWLLRHHRLAAGLLVVAVAGLTGVALLVGPPA